jgi:hypothetical protein
VLYDNLTPFRENALMLDVSDSHSTTEPSPLQARRLQNREGI